MIVPVLGCNRMVSFLEELVFWMINLFCDHPVEAKFSMLSRVGEFKLLQMGCSSIFTHFQKNGVVLLQMCNRFQNVVQTSLHMMGQYIPKILNNGGTVLDNPHFVIVIQPYPAYVQVNTSQEAKHRNANERGTLPSGKHTKNYWYGPFIVDLPIEKTDVP